MNSPPDPASPATSTPSSGSPPPEEASSYVPATASNYLSNLTSHITATFVGGSSSSSSSKRRLPTGSTFGAASSTRELKTRKRGEPGRSGGTAWEGIKESGGKKEKDELLDQALVEHLRKEIGDPFLEVGIKG